jgi:hypothetical protein
MTAGLLSRMRGSAILRILFIAALSILLVAPAATSEENTRLSIFDESTHLDNAWRWAHFDIPQKGEQISPEILSEWTCRGFYDSNVPFPPCTAVEEIPNANFPFSLSNYNTKHPPIYYIINGFVGRALVELSPIDSFVSAVRIANSMWVFAVVLIARRVFSTLGVRGLPNAILAAFSVLVPVAFNTWTYANNDVASYTSSWLIVWAGIRATRVGLRNGLALLVVASIVGTLTKGFTIGAVIATTILLGPTVRESFRRGVGRARTALYALIPGLAGSTMVVAWLVFQRLHRSDNPFVKPIIREQQDGIPWAGISEEVIRVTAPTGQLPKWILAESPFLTTTFLRWLEIATWGLSVAANPTTRHAAATRSSRWNERSIGVATILSAPILAGVIVSYNMLVGSPVFIRVIDRYYVSVLPLFVISLAVAMANRRHLSRAVTAFLSGGLVIQTVMYAMAVV